jgi:uncharacterized protein HemX
MTKKIYSILMTIEEVDDKGQFLRLMSLREPCNGLEQLKVSIDNLSKHANKMIRERFDD